MKKVFLSIFVWILFLWWINFWSAWYIWWKKWKELQKKARENLKLLENTSWQCKKEISSLVENCEKTYWSLHWLNCLNKMLSDGKAWVITLLVYNTEIKCASNSMLNKRVLNRKQVVSTFCKDMSSYKRVLNNLDFINAQNSIFLKILCNTTKIYTSEKFKENLNLKKGQVKYYWQLVRDAQKNSSINFWLFWKCKNKNGINTDPNSLNNVNFVCVANDIWNKLAEDEINIGSYLAYWWFSTRSWFRKWQADFFSWSVCSNYFSVKSNKGYCFHPNAYRYLKQTQTSLKSILKNFNLFNNVNNINDIQKIILDRQQLKKCSNWWCLPFFSLKDSIYNELYFYTYFLSYYWKEIQNNTSYLQLKKAWTSIGDIDLSTSKEFMQAKRSIMVARLSIKKSFDLLKNIYWTYPIHVWFLAIIEDFKKLRKDLAKIYTPIDQLRYKLENVQDLSKQ